MSVERLGAKVGPLSPVADRHDRAERRLPRPR